MRGWLILLAACHSNPGVSVDAPLDTSIGPTANAARLVTDTKLAFDVTALTGTATISFAASDAPGASLEVGDLAIDAASVMTANDGKGGLTLALPGDATSVDFAFHYQNHEGLQGASADGYTLTWPYFCGNLFPCHSAPSDGTTFSLSLTGIPDGKVAIYPTSIPSAAPAYQLAWSMDAYTEIPLGTTTAGTSVSVWYQGGLAAKATTGSKHLVAAFDWLEQTIGPYRFGNHVGSVSVRWPAGQFGGMEHHPFWHIAAAAMADEVTHVHESAHGWFGDGIRIQCWEDFVLSKNTVSYLAGRALDVVAPTVGANAWAGYETELGQIQPDDLVWPTTCGAVDVIADHLFTDAPYMRGAFFYRAVALKIGADKLDQALHAFYMAHATGSARMSDMLQTIQDVTGFDPHPCAELWLHGQTIPAVGACPT